jgi:putative inorganic carbon (hco3(-)) transporter
MRDIVLTLAFLTALPLTFRFPFAGMLVWAWVGMMAPQRQVYSFATNLPFNLIIATLTISVWLLSREHKRLNPDATPWVMVAFAAWMTVNAALATNPDASWPLWELTMKGFVFVLLAGAMLTTKTRVHAMVWIVVVAIGYYGVKGGLFVLLTGGAYRVYGPESTIIADNNQLAVAICMIVPLVVYLRNYSRNRLVRTGLTVAIPLLIFAVLGSYSRGGLIALCAMLSVFLLRSQHKALYLVIGLAVIVPALAMMPDAFWERMATIEDMGQDHSFMGRVMSWQVCLYYAIDHFPFGAGFAGTQFQPVFQSYFPGVDGRAAHSIYFQALGEHGFIGLGFYFAIMILGLRNAAIVVRQTRNRPGFGWAYELARMIQAGLSAFFVGGAALSMAYYDGYLLLLIVLSALRELTAPAKASAKQAPATPSTAESAALEVSSVS